MKFLHKYFFFYKLRLQRTLIYPGTVVMYRLSNLLLLTVIIFLWLSAQSSGLIGGYTKEKLISYYLIGALVNSIVFWYTSTSIKREIIEGELGTSVLTKPISYYWSKFFQELAYHTLSPLFALATIGIILFFIPTTLYMPPITTVIAVIFSLAFASVIFFNLSSSIGLLAFWFTQTEGIANFVWVGVYILGGQAIPISFFSNQIQSVINLLPFRFIYSFPLEIYFGQLTVREIIQGFTTQLFWILVLGILFKKLWQAGLKQNSAFGG